MNDDWMLRGMSGLGFVALLGVALLLSSKRQAVNWRGIAWGVGAQWLLAFLLLGTQSGQLFYEAMNFGIGQIVTYTNAGSSFVFGPPTAGGYSFALGVLPIIIFMGSLFGILYHVGIVQPIVRALAWPLSRTLRTSGAESLAAVANIFVGMTESGLVVRPYLESMTRSELFAFMTLGMSTIAGSVLVAYATFLGGGDFGGHLVIASLISAPAGLVVAKIMLPETEEPVTAGIIPKLDAPTTGNVIDAAAEGGLAGMRLALNIGALLIAFVALVALANGFLGWIGGSIGTPGLTLQSILGWVCAPLAFLMGIPWHEAQEVGSLIGIKTVLNEFLAYQSLGESISTNAISQRSAIIATYALCGFANFGSLAIMLGSIDALAPTRRAEAAALGLRSIVGGTLATCLTGCLAGVMF